MPFTFLDHTFGDSFAIMDVNIWPNKKLNSIASIWITFLLALDISLQIPRFYPSPAQRENPGSLGDTNIQDWQRLLGGWHVDGVGPSEGAGRSPVL